MKNEKEFQREFGKWLKHNWTASSAFELKVVRTPNFYISHIKPHQITGLKVAKDSLLYWKIADSDSVSKPFDCFTLCRVKAYIVLIWLKRANKTFYIIPIDKIIKLKYNNISEEKAAKLAERIGELKYI